jgi:translation initiation factor IF-2
MRVYEIAKEYGVSSREVLEALNKAGIKLASHMSVVPDGGERCLEKVFGEAKRIASSEKGVVGTAAAKEKKVVKTKNVPTSARAKADNVPARSEIKKTIEKKKPTIVEKTKVAPAPAPKKVSKPAVKKVRKKTLPSRPGRFVRQAPPLAKVVTEIEVEKEMPLFAVADLMGKSSGDLILVLLKKGMACNRNYVLSVETISMLGDVFDIDVIVKTSEVLSVEASALKKVDKGSTRWPVVVVMGHVDHGKTTLLDYVRKMNVAAREKGGITQHLGAYEVDCSHGKIIFLDTPGHEAFSYIRSRGAKVTDIAILVVAADDGVKPQTIEAIEHAKANNVPLLVAINKIDKVESVSAASVQTIKRQLAEHDLVVEDWGGDVIAVPISAKTGEGVEDLLEMIVLQAQMMDLKADPDLPAKAFILESKLEKGYGPVATVISLEGTIKKGDYFVCGTGTGKVRLLINSLGEKISQAGPSVPVKIVGFDKFAEIGDWLRVVGADEYFKVKSGKVTAVSGAPLKAMTPAFTEEKEENIINLIIKVDTRGSREAIEGSVAKLSKRFRRGYPALRILRSGVGDISEGDVELASTTNSYVIGFHVKVEKNATLLARDKNIDIELFDIIYHMVDFLEDILKKRKEVELVWNRVGQAVVKKVFEFKKIGIVAGCGVVDGVCSNGNKVVCLRGGKPVGEGKIVSLQREGKIVKEVHAGYECGFVCDGFNNWQEGDIVECYKQEKETSGEKARG